MTKMDKILENNVKFNRNGLVSLVSAAVSGIIIHLFCLLKFLNNYDNIAVQPAGYGTGIKSGRWLLTILGDLNATYMGAYNLSWLNGVVGILFLSVSIYFLVDIFKIKSRIYAILLGVGFVAFPSVASCMLFTYTVQYYSFAILMSVIASYMLIEGKRKFFVIYGILSAVLIACSLGIYQAYFPLTTAILVLYLIQQTLLSKDTWKTIICKGFYYLSSLVLGLVLYFVILKLCLKFYGEELLGYQGISTMGQMPFVDLIKQIWYSFAGFFTMPVENSYMLAPLPLLSLIYQLWNVATAIMIITNLIHRKSKPIYWAITLVLCVCFPIAVNLLVIMCANAWIYTLMVHAFVLLLFVPVVTFESLYEPQDKYIIVRQGCKHLISLSLALVVFMYSYLANVSYTAEYYANRQVENLANSVVTQVRMTEGFHTGQKWVFLGKYEDPLMPFRWGNVPLYEGTATPSHLIQSYSWTEWIRHYIGYSVPLADEQKKQELMKDDTVKEMPSWPSYGSVRIVDDTVVVKFSD